ncbi:FAD-binding oxidoreductase [Aquicoccus porphyridii]|uniref:FAD-binding oxidoreductase n=1 Tax=Aquicoccus porphyridii TaxID=1852029 RepID=A0A5A9Z6J7_9RHOB|nr:FAD-binding oxidoreductase [Aquicoccus porphyridii]KAA0912679.1 FAD-binding oxidoreductase [Aquicoccus porphyridii]RAI55488.1 FAD-dependent oxidoreductase [Rhodobacteraceae bacterium AsT-22]
MVDVTIRGAGVFGLSIAWECLARGATVRVVDPNGPGAGASGGVVGALAPHVPENWNDKKAFQLQSLLAAEDFWAGVEAAGGISPGFARLGRLQPVLDDNALALARAREATARTLWQGRAEWRVIAADTTADWTPHSPTGWLIHDTLTARIHPRQAVRALVAAIGAKGGEVTAKASDEGAVIWAAGTWDLDRISTALGRMVGNGVKGQAALFALDARDRPQVFADGVHIIPHADGTVAVGSTSERDYEHPESTDERLDAVIAKAIAAMPVLSGVRIIEAWAGLRPRAKSRAPMLGHHPLAPDQFIANGGFKIGFGMAPGVARAMADLVLDGRDTIPDGFRPEASL